MKSPIPRATGSPGPRSKFPGSNRALWQFQESLLRPTLVNALRTPFYRRLYGCRSLAIKDVDDLKKLPLVRRSELQQAGPDAQRRTGLRCDEIATSGTTGPPFIVKVSTREQRFMRRFFQSFCPDISGRLLRGIQFIDHFHGHERAAPAPIHFHRLCLYSPGSFARAAQLLTAGEQDAGVEHDCSIMIGIERIIYSFARWLREDPSWRSPFRLERLVTYGNFLTRRNQKFIEEALGCAVTDLYGLTEIFGGALREAETGWYYFEPYVIPEVIEVKSEKVIENGVGELVLTALHPFQTAQPMVRYRTGDLVQVSHSAPNREGRLAFKPLGRISKSIPASTDGWWLTAGALYEALDNCSHVARKPLFQDSLQVNDPYIVGYPDYTVSAEDRRGVRTVILRFRPSGRDAHLAIRQVSHHVLNSSSRFRRAVDRGAAGLEVALLEPSRN